MADVLFVLHSRVDPNEPHLLAAMEVLRARGRSVEVLQRRDPTNQPAGLGSSWALDPALVEGCELVVTFGGDGTFLHAARTAIRFGVPVLGVNLGRLGFLAWVDLAKAPDALTAWLDGECEIETRATIVVERDGSQHIAINEAALRKHQHANVIEIEVLLDGGIVGRFHADGAVVATPTGSTAYAVSAGGPILDPRVDAVVVVPLNPHTLAARALVLPAHHPVEVRVDESTVLELDGAEDLDIPADEGVTCSLDGPLLKVVRAPSTPDFYQQLRERMGWGEPLVREGRSLRGG
ncbi:MAG TPA: NAD(+)/NADH kinase [Candidatus Dormibacteraeota bacterium]|jgi:NAD+ kinase|nr:NAD(+)/NADH kinase [Candidatus Dormibacteraeota bacterium]